eukprot:s6514_g1.t1
MQVVALANLRRHASKGLVLSWSEHGGPGHPNAKPWSQVHQLVKDSGFQMDPDATKTIRTQVGDSPAPSMRTGYRLEVIPGEDINMLLSRLIGRKAPEVRAYSYSTGLQLPGTTLLSACPSKFCIQTWSLGISQSLSQNLLPLHVQSRDRQQTKDYRVLVLRRLSPWEFWDECSSDFRAMNARITQLEDQSAALQRQIQDLET